MYKVEEAVAVKEGSQEGIIRLCGGLPQGAVRVGVGPVGVSQGAIRVVAATPQQIASMQERQLMAGQDSRLLQVLLKHFRWVVFIS